jgi:hypothetical protein
VTEARGARESVAISKVAEHLVLGLFIAVDLIVIVDFVAVLSLVVVVGFVAQVLSIASQRKHRWLGSTAWTSSGRRGC